MSDTKDKATKIVDTIMSFKGEQIKAFQILLKDASDKRKEELEKMMRGEN